TISATTTNKKNVILTATTQLTIVKKATGISLDYSTVTMGLNYKKTLTSTRTPTDASYTHVTWSTSDSTIVAISVDGVLTGKSLGTATVTVTLANGGSPLSATCEVTVKELTSTDDGAVVKLNTHTLGHGIPIILLGDGFTDSEVTAGDYEAAMEEARDDLFSVVPITKLYQYFDVYYVTAISSSSTFGKDKTAFGVSISSSDTKITGDDDACIEYAQNAISNIQHSLIVVVLNINKYAGTTYMYYNAFGNTTYNYYYYSIAYCPMSRETKEKGMDFASLIHHEAIGHGLAKLGDEYYYEDNGTIPQTKVSDYESAQKYGYYSNGDFSNDSTDVSWGSLLSSGNYTSEGLSMYEGGFTYAYGVYRPTETSIMYENTGGFNAPSRMAIYKYVNLLANKGDWTFDLNTFLTWDKQFLSTRKSSATRSTRSSSSIWKPLHAPRLMPINK
ncbi:MAG: M64 family metallo-endopeptidase, partial [Bacteroidaceae bacterium]|nr:M64 family metallo-endopeptidase [Bacteroidaceae bacterium]